MGTVRKQMIAVRVRKRGLPPPGKKMARGVQGRFDDYQHSNGVESLGHLTRENDLKLKV